MNPYEVLGLKQNASDRDIKAAWRSKAQKTHPDREGGSTEKFKEVQLAYEILSDPLRRKKFDDTGSIEGEGESLHTMAMQSIAGLALNMAAGEMRGNMVEAIKASLIELTEKHRNAKVQGQKRIAKFERVMGRFKLKRGKEGENLFTSTFQLAIRNLEQEVLQAERMIKCGEIALGILADYEFEVEAPTGYIPGISGPQQAYYDVVNDLWKPK